MVCDNCVISPFLKVFSHEGFYNFDNFEVIDFVFLPDKTLARIIIRRIDV